MIRAPEFVKWVKIRIGEPLTALDMNERKPSWEVGVVIFGSISGYIGYYQFASNTLKYIENTFEELIRAVSLPPTQIYIDRGRAFGVIGDR